MPTPFDAHALRHRLIGMNVAATLAVRSTAGEKLCLARRSASFIVYLFPGSATSPAHGADTPLTDAEEHRGFRDLHKQITAQEATVVGVSSQSAEKLKDAIAKNRLCQPLASDPNLRVGELLKLPTFRVGAECLYERLTLLITAGRITEVFYPVLAPNHHAGEVLDYITERCG